MFDECCGNNYGWQAFGQLYAITRGDKWIISKLNTLVKEVDDKLEHYDITTAALQIESFTDELSNWYVRRNRERFWAQELNDEKIGAYVTLYKVLKIISMKHN